MEYNTVLVNFCERKLYPNQPEYINAFSAFYISAISYYNLVTTQNKSTNLSIINWCICINGLASFLYHWYAWYLFRLFDEFTMIIPIWFGLSKILFDLDYNMHFIGIITLINMLILVFNVFPWFDQSFCISFLIELLLIIPFYCQALEKYPDINKDGIKGIIICSGSGIVWWITELNCNKYLIFGHALWHIGISTGLCYIINYFSTIEIKGPSPLKIL